MKISVLIATYNGERYISKQIESLLSQSIKPHEIIICDDCSSDNTVQLVKNFFYDKDISYNLIVHETNLGVQRTFQDAVEASTGDVLFFCDQDDVWKNDKIETMIGYFKGDIDVVFSNAELVDGQLSSMNDTMWNSISFSINEDITVDCELLAREYLKRNFVTGMSMAVSRKFALECLPFPKMMMFDSWIALNAITKFHILAINRELSYYRQHNNNVIGANRKINIKSVKKSMKNYYENLVNQYDASNIIYKMYTDSKLSDDLKLAAKEYHELMMYRVNIFKDSKFKVIVIGKALRNQYKKYFLNYRRFILKDIICRLVCKESKCTK